MDQYQSAPMAAPPSLYDQHAKAVACWHEACRRFAEASQQREQAAAVLQKVGAEFAQFIERQMQDPTVPQQAPMNGLAMQAANQQVQTRSW